MKFQAGKNCFKELILKLTMTDQLTLSPNKYDFVLFPIVNRDIWGMYKKAVASFWTVEEVDLRDDLNDWETLNDNEKHFIKNVLCFFASSDNIVNVNLAENFINEININEVKCFYGFQIAIENIHSEMYSLLIDTFISDAEEKDACFNILNGENYIKTKAAWALNWCESTNFLERLFAFAIVEGIFFSSAFCSIFWLKQRGLMPGLCFSNELISRDEALHCEFACMLYTYAKKRLTQERVYQIIQEAVDIERGFVQESFKEGLLGINSKLMEQYVEFCADRLLSATGYMKLYKVTNPFNWMDKINIDGKTNFFEKRVSEYSKRGVVVSETFDFSTDSHF